MKGGAATLVLLGGLAGCGDGGGPADPPDAGPADAPAPPELPPVDNVDPFIGSGGFGFASGSAFPGAAAPHGLAKVGPDTSGPYQTINFLHYSGYWYGDDTILGFSHLHLHGTGATDYGVLGVMPSVTPEAPPSTFDKASEEARPGRYAVTLDAGPIRVEIAATPHGAHHRYVYLAPAAQGWVVFDLDHHLDSGTVPEAEVAIDPAARTFHGRLRSLGGMSRGFGGYDVFFAGRTLGPIEDSLVWSGGGAAAPGVSASGQGVGFALRQDPTQPVEVQVAVSLVDAAGAEANLAAELPDFAFADTAARTERDWADRVGRIRVSGGTPDERRIFYSALYRALLMPSWVGDPDGRWRTPVDTVATGDWHQLSDLSLWDTYRTLHPLYSLAWPEDAADSVRSLLAFAESGGFFPRWPVATGESGTMIGASAEVVVADAVLKGAAGALDAEAAYRILRAAALDPSAPPGGRGGRSGVEAYLQDGWIAATVDGSVSKTVEFAQDDAALAELAAFLGHDADAATLRARSHGWRALFDPGSGFLRARWLDGSFADEPFDPVTFLDAYVEANAWQSSWPAHDVAGLVEAYGGEAPLVAALEDLFARTAADWAASDPTSLMAQASPRSFYWHGNEPDLQVAWFFAQAGRPDLTDRWVPWVMDAWYRDTPDGLAGNDDGGTLSAWYVFAALGLYPIAGTDRYVLTLPRFPHAEIDLPGGVFTIIKDGPGTDVASVDLDGTPLATRELRHAQLQPGSTLRYLMQ